MGETELKYRSNVAGILQNEGGKILVCERLGLADAWQFPQGGIDGDETPEEALARELWEEVGIVRKHYSVVLRKGPLYYLYGNGRTKKGFHGKEQIYFLCRFLAPDSLVDVATRHPEFQAYRWIAPVEFQIRWLPEMKRAVYRTVFAEFFGVTL